MVSVVVQIARYSRPWSTIQVGLKSYYATFTILIQPDYRECVFCIKARSPVMDASFSFCLDRNKDEYDLTKRYIYKPHPPALAGRMVRQHLSTSLSLSHSLTDSLSPSNFFFLSSFHPPVKCIGQLLTALSLTTVQNRNTRKPAFKIKA